MILTTKAQNLNKAKLKSAKVPKIYFF